MRGKPRILSLYINSFNKFNKVCVLSQILFIMSVLAICAWTALRYIQIMFLIKKDIANKGNLLKSRTLNINNKQKYF